jgi:hypothetical protein
MTSWKIVWCWATGHKWRLNIIDIHDLFNEHLTQTCKRCGHMVYAPEITKPLIPDCWVDTILEHNIKPLSTAFMIVEGENNDEN